ncbi:MAG: 1-acyl-sn-glycerol-3-phosphate acyltransferase [Acidobacteria bacterium]|nr:1-acyl-sn-glycerol-3-phosphate acyltransferase [Acidobacteriota bacterium]
MSAPSTAAPPTAPPGRISSWVWAVARLAIRIFYRVERIGGALPDGPLLLVANHPNTLADPALIQATAGRAVRFLAKSTLFADHVVSPLIRRSGAIPVYRRMDPGVDTSRNVETFAAVQATLEAGEAVCLFPEGKSHAAGRLEPLRTGAARMVLAGGRPVTLVAVGLNFSRLARFRSRVTVVFGRPFEAEDLRVAGAADGGAADAVRRLTERIEERLRHLMIEAEPRLDLPIVERVDRLYTAARGVSRDPRERVGRRRLIARGIEELRARDPERLAEIVGRVDDYDASLARFGLRDRDLDREVPFAAAVRFAVREGALALLLAPLAILTLAVFAAPYWITGEFARRAPDIQSRATWQLLAGAVAYPTWIGVVAVTIGAGVGATAGLLSVPGLAALALGGMGAVERELSVLRTVRAFRALRRTPAEARAALHRQRAVIADVLDRAREWLDEPGGR